MKIFLDCLPCMLRQVLEAARLSTDDNEIQEKIVSDSLEILLHYKEYECSPDLALAMHQRVKIHTNNADPYRAVKNQDLEAALGVYMLLNVFLRSHDNELYWALKIAATGNNIDSAIYSNINIEQCIEKELAKRFRICDMERFRLKLENAKTLLIIGDNAGETVFDRVFAESLLPLNIIYAVRNAPIINDATIEDANASGLNTCATIVSTGCNAPGAILSQCSPAFLKSFYSADIVISKGQGNFEALSNCNREVYFLLKAKCAMISKKLGVNLNEYVFIRHAGESEAKGDENIGQTGKMAKN
jgi:damage-control phosphatase, subfamily I